MQIPGGDLAPARRRRYGGSYGRRRRRRAYGLAVVAVVAVSSAAFVLTRGPEPRQTVSSPTPEPCTTPSAAPAGAVVLPGQVRLDLLNGTSRNGLAKTVGEALEGRGFVVPVKANAPAALPGPTRVVFGPGAEVQGALVASHIAGSIAVSDPQRTAGSVQVTLGSSYQRLATADEAQAAQPRSTPTPDACASLQR